MNSVTHLAGPRIQIGDRVIQRCSICGEKLVDNLNVSIILNPDGTVPEYPSWEVGRLVRQVFGSPSTEFLLPDSDTLPEDNCLLLVE